MEGASARARPMVTSAAAGLLLFRQDVVMTDGAAGKLTTSNRTVEPASATARLFAWNASGWRKTRSHRGAAWRGGPVVAPVHPGCLSMWAAVACRSFTIHDGQTTDLPPVLLAVIVDVVFYASLGYNNHSTTNRGSVNNAEYQAGIGLEELQ